MNFIMHKSIQMGEFVHWGERKIIEKFVSTDPICFIGWKSAFGGNMELFEGF
jgi:hypothetical protein